MSALKVTQIKSGIATKPKHRGTLRALGLGKIGRTNLLPDRPEIRGMLARVPFLVTVEEVAGDAGPQKYPKKAQVAASKAQA
jgi:large subunit ribosomal protein L30